MTRDQIAQAKSIAKRNANRFDTVSQLAEFIATLLDITDELDDETSEIWLIAFENFDVE